MYGYHAAQGVVPPHAQQGGPTDQPDATVTPVVGAGGRRPVRGGGQRGRARTEVVTGGIAQVWFEQAECTTGPPTPGTTIRSAGSVRCRPPTASVESAAVTRPPRRLVLPLAADTGWATGYEAVPDLGVQGTERRPSCRTTVVPIPGPARSRPTTGSPCRPLPRTAVRGTAGAGGGQEDRWAPVQGGAGQLCAFCPV